jgi:hypothetical protein
VCKGIVLLYYGKTAFLFSNFHELSRIAVLWDPLELTMTIPYLIVDSEVQLSIPTIQRERGGVGKVSPVKWAHLYLSANFHYRFFVSIEKGRLWKRGENWFMS